MWLSKQQKRTAAGAAGETGAVTLSGDTLAVELDSERRGLEVYAPGGYRWKPDLGQKVLVLKTRGGPCVVGAKASAAGLSPGETALESAGGAAVRLDNQGGVTLGPTVRVDGTLYVGGRELTELVREIAVQAAGSILGG